MNTVDEIALTEGQAAKALNCSASTLRKWRRERRGPEVILLGGRPLVRYLAKDILDWLHKNRRNGE